MHLEGSCHCGAVRFSVTAYAPVPYLRCYCSICRKTAGAGGYAINLGARSETLRIEGEENITVFHARVEGKESPAERRFCSRCGSALWGCGTRAGPSSSTRSQASSTHRFQSRRRSST
jgi:hypothetical protein